MQLRIRQLQTVMSMSGMYPSASPLVLVIKVREAPPCTRCSMRIFYHVYPHTAIANSHFIYSNQQCVCDIGGVHILKVRGYTC